MPIRPRNADAPKAVSALTKKRAKARPFCILCSVFCVLRLQSEFLQESREERRIRLRDGCLLQHVDRVGGRLHGDDAEALRAAFGELVDTAREQDGARAGVGDHVDAVLWRVVDEEIDPKRLTGFPARTRQRNHARQLEAVLHEPALRLPLHRLPRRGRALRDEEHFPLVLLRGLPQAPHHPVFHRLQRRPEIGRRLDGVPDDVVVPAHRACLREPLARDRGRIGPAARRRDVRGTSGVGGGALLRFLLLLARLRLRLAVLGLVGAEQAVFDFMEGGRQVGQGAVHVEGDAEARHWLTILCGFDAHRGGGGHFHQILPVLLLRTGSASAHELLARRCIPCAGDLLGAGDLQPLPLLDRLDEARRLVQRFVRAGVEPGDAAASSSMRAGRARGTRG